MLLEEESAPFDDDDYIYELKLDGIRCLAYLNKTTELRNKRNKDVTQIYPELSELYKCVKRKCILDGELVCLDSGKPDFFSLQKRALMTDPFKIKLDMLRTNVQFVAYDILYLDKDVTKNTMLERKVLLQKNVTEGHGLTISRYYENNGIALFKAAKDENLEGIVAKKKNGCYHIGKRTKDWIKIKNMIDEDLIVCGFKLNDDGKIKDLVLGYYDKTGKLQTRGNVSLGISKSDQALILKFAKTNTIAKPWFDKKDVTWLKLKLVGTAHYMKLTDNGHMRQPVWKGLRDDKLPKDCMK